MNLLEQAQAGSDAIQFPSPRRVQDAPGIQSTERTRPVQKPVPVFDSIKAGLSNASVVQLYEGIVEPEVFYFPDEEDLTKHADELLPGIPLDKQHLIMGESSLGNARQRREQILDTLETQRTQYANGMVLGLGSDVASYFDPIGFVLGGGVSTLMKIPKTYRATKTAIRLMGAASVAGSTFIEESVRQSRSGMDTDDVFYATAGAAAIGGVIAPLLTHGVTPIDNIALHAEERTKTVAKAVQKDLDDAMHLHPERDKQSMNIPDEKYDITGAGIEITDDLKAKNPGTLGENLTDQEYQIAAHAKELVKNGEVSNIHELGQMKTLLEKNPLMSDGIRAAASESDVAQVIAAHVGEIATGTRGKVATSAALHKNQIERKAFMQLNPVLKQAQMDYLAKRGIKKYNIFKYNGSGKRQFDEALRLELAARYSGKEADNVDDAIKAAADAYDRTTRQVWGELKKSGWRGADEVTWKSGYFPLQWSGAAIAKLKNAGRIGAVNKVLNIAYMNAGMSEELAERLTRAVVDRSLARASDLDFNPAALFTKAGRGDLEKMLRDAGTSDLDIKGIMKLVDKDNTNGINKRTDIDLTTEFEGVRILDLTQGDMNNLASRWIQRNAGMAGLAKKGIKDFDTIDSMKKLARSQAAAHGEDAEKLGHSVDAIFDTMLARPVYGGVSRNTRRLLDWSMVTKLGQIGFAQVAEMSNISAAHGLFQSLKAVPEAGKLYSQLRTAAKTGDWAKLDKAFMGEIQVFGGSLIDEHLLYRPSVHLDETVDTGWMGTMDNVMAMATDGLGSLSGMYQVKGLEQTLVTMLQAQKVAKLFKGKLANTHRLRLAELGWGTETIARIHTELNKHAVFNKGVLDRLNLSQWNELARTEYLQGIHRHVNHAIQLPSAGEGTYWMHKDVAALMLQFRSFPMLAVEKQTGRHLIAGDAEASMAVMYGLAYSSVAGMAKTYTNAIGRSDRDEYIEKHLTPAALTVTAMNYASALSLAGDMAGVTSALVGMPLSGRVGGFFPALDGVYRASKGIAAVGGALNPYSDVTLTERDVRNAVSALPLGNTLQMGLISNQILSTLNKEK